MQIQLSWWRGVCVYRYHMLIFAVFQDSRMLDRSVLLGNWTCAVTHSQMSGSLTDTVSGALFSCPGFDGIGSYTQSNSIGILICPWWRLSWRAQLGVKSERFCWESLRVRPCPHRAWGPPGVLGLGELLPHLISCSISEGEEFQTHMEDALLTNSGLLPNSPSLYRLF